MMKPGTGAFERFQRMFERFSREAGKEQYLIPYFIAAHPGTSDRDMLNLALWLKRTDSGRTRCRLSPDSTCAGHGDVPHRTQPLRKIKRDGERLKSRAVCASAVCTKLSCDIMTRKTGR